MRCMCVLASLLESRTGKQTPVCLTGAAIQKKTPVYWRHFLVALRDTTTLVSLRLSLLSGDE